MHRFMQLQYCKTVRQRINLSYDILHIREKYDPLGQLWVIETEALEERFRSKK